MKPILLIHGYSSEGKSNTVSEIYGSLPDDLRKIFGADKVKELNLSRWISLSNGIRIDDVSYALERALKSGHSRLLKSGFNVIIHSTGALVVRNWIKNHCKDRRPCPIQHLVHLAGANFGSGLAHVGKGQLARWGRLIVAHTGSGIRILDELEFGSWKTIDLHTYFLEPGNDMYRDFGVLEYCIAGSQIPTALQLVPIRYIKEDSSDNTVRTSASNLNFNLVSIRPKSSAFQLSVRDLDNLVEQRLNNRVVVDQNYEHDLSLLSKNRTKIPFAIAYETAHFGEGMGIVSGENSRSSVMPLIQKALSTDSTEESYESTNRYFDTTTKNTFKRISNLKYRTIGWNKHTQYEGHAQLIFRIRDQFGIGVKDFDITIKTLGTGSKKIRLETLIEDVHKNGKHHGTLTYYMRTQSYNKRMKRWDELLNSISPVNVEITGHEPDSDDVKYVPLNLKLTSSQLREIISSFQTTIIDVELLRLPRRNVFQISKG